ncbi:MULTISPECIES: HEPN domain-containing protein [Acinetobacter]|jgi:hypothetical protein|uniref:Uncharacterized protein n=1 Tax=Acinetobacter pittii TaxID=48296 RepID=A0A242U9K2_ACIPI|nr:MULTISPECIES: HEPN domain-containing protein [Acinetobacter]MBJ8501042.1 hypothetical protein [Acinetobacter pittii]MBJ9891869.1 hypothetical protein [Acinetobacter pittii]MCU4477937.1 hypothetical protein [Acinetobacter sp. WU_MDCI_Abxd143]OTU30496.1 hypothetical protein CAT59_01065 [Acinetobacter pittii]
MSDYLVVKILDTNSFTLPNTLIYGEVELRSASTDSAAELIILKESAEDNKLDFAKYSYTARISTIVHSDTTREAEQQATDRFSSVLDLIMIKFPTSNVELSQIGFIKNLESGETIPIKKWEFSPSLSFVVSHGNIQRIDPMNFILSQKTELSERFLKSLYWARHSHHENNKQLKILFSWFALEALLKENEDDYIGSIVCFCLGFPGKRKAHHISQEFMKKIESHPKYFFWLNKLTTEVNNIREFRNHSVHDGFRIVDCPKDTLALYEQIMIYGISRSQQAIQHALLNGISTVTEFKEYLPFIFEETVRISDVHGTIIYSLERVLFDKTI